MFIKRLFKKKGESDRSDIETIVNSEITNDAGEALGTIRSVEQNEDGSIEKLMVEILDVETQKLKTITIPWDMVEVREDSFYMDIEPGFLQRLPGHPAEEEADEAESGAS